MEKLKEFWDSCDKGFAQISKNMTHLAKEWDSYFLHKLNSLVDFPNSTFIDYGIGAAYLGLHLSQKYNLKKYTGIDISLRQLYEA